MTKFTVYLSIILVMTAITFSAEGADVFLWEGFEKENGFYSADWENTVIPKLSIVPNYYSEGTHSLKVEFQRSPKEWVNKTAFYKDVRLDLSNAKVILDVYNFSFFNLEIALGFDTSREHVFYESITKPIKRGWNKDIVFDLATYDFKSKQTDWQYSTHLKDAGDVKRFFIIVYYPDDFKSATIYIDNVRFEADGKSKF